MSIDLIIWAAMFMSTVVYAVVAGLLQGPGQLQPFEQVLRTPPVPLLYLLAAASFAVSMIVSARMRNQTQRHHMIVGLALSESGAVLGFLAAVLAHDWRLYLGPWALTLIGFLRLFPAREPG